MKKFKALFTDNNIYSEAYLMASWKEFEAENYDDAVIYCIQYSSMYKLWYSQLQEI